MQSIWTSIGTSRLKWPKRNPPLGTGWPGGPGGSALTISVRRQPPACRISRLRMASARTGGHSSLSTAHAPLTDPTHSMPCSAMRRPVAAAASVSANQLLPMCSASNRCSTQRSIHQSTWSSGPSGPTVVVP